MWHRTRRSRLTGCYNLRINEVVLEDLAYFPLLVLDYLTHVNEWGEVTADLVGFGSLVTTM